MAKSVRTSPNERLDREDVTAMLQFQKGSIDQRIQLGMVDRRGRILQGFSVELPDQATYPGRLVFHGGRAYDFNGQLLFNEDQLDISRTITLEGAGTTFYLEAELVEVDSALDARAFWDPTVDQGFDPSGDARPDGQEFNSSVATRKTYDWRIVQPISVAGFDKDTNPLSLKVPLLKIKTDGANQIVLGVNPDLSTEAARTLLLVGVAMAATSLYVQDSTDLPDVGGSLIVGFGLASQETIAVVSNDRASGVMGTAPLANAHSVGEIICAVSAGPFVAPVFIKDKNRAGAYQRPLFANAIDFRDRMFQGDESHGDILTRGTDSITDRHDLSLQGLKDYVDFLSAQLEEMKWGCTAPWEGGTSSRRTPPGLSTSLPTAPRYYDRTAGIMGSRLAAVTVGDGVSSWGDFNGTSQVALQKAHDALPVAGGRIFLKRGTYTLSGNFNWTNTGSVVLEGEEGSKITTSGGAVHIATTGSVAIKNLTIQGGTSNVGILVDTANPSGFWVENVLMQNAAFNLNALLPGTASFRRVWFWGTVAGMAAIPLFKITGAAGTISGTFSECDFNHATMVSISAALIDCVNGAPALALSQANFVDCSFNTLLLNGESVHLGATSNVVHFDRCLFWSGLTLCHVRASGGTNIRLTNCVGMDGAATFFQGTGATHLDVNGYLNNISVGLPAVDLTNCNNVKIRNCDVKVGSAASLSNCAFKITSTAGTLYDNVIENNSIKGNTVAPNNKPTGIVFALNGGAATEFKNVKIKGNHFDALETGIYFSNPGVAGTYRDVLVANNQLTDVDGVLGIAANFKLGILFGSSSTRQNATISGNTIQNLDPATVDLVSGNSRAGIMVLGSSNTNINIVDNVIDVVGNVGFTVADTAGIYLSTMTGGSVVGNTISRVEGKAGFGIRATGSLNKCQVAGNSIRAVHTVAGGAGIQVDGWGIYAPVLAGVSFSSNQFSDISADGGLYGIAVGVDDAVGTWTDVTIAGNTTTGASHFVFATLFGFGRSSISGNTFNGTNTGIRLVAKAGATFETVAVTGNTLIAQNGVYADWSGAAVYVNLTVSGNTIQATSGFGVYANKIYGCAISGNDMRSDADFNNIYMASSTRVAITGNYLLMTAAATQANVYMGGGCNIYNIHNNVCDQSGAGGVKSIDTSTAVVGGVGLVTNNVVDIVENLRAADNAVGGLNLQF